MDGEARSFRPHSTLRRVLATLATIGVVMTGMIASAPPASAAALTLSGEVACQNGAHVITWTITNHVAQTVTITSALTAKDPASYDVTGYAPTLAPGATTHGTTVIPGSATGVVVLYVYETWDESSGSDHTALDLGAPCTAASTTTTSTTVASTTTVAPTSTITAAAAGSTVATTAPASSTTVAPLAQLPRTGSSSKGAIGGGLTLALGGLALVLSGRKRHRYAQRQSHT